MNFEKKRKEFLAKRLEERMKWVDFWASFVKTHSDAEWSKRQKMLIDSQIQGARNFGMSPAKYLQIKDEIKKTKTR